MVEKYTVEGSDLSAIAEALRSKLSINDSLVFPDDYISAVNLLDEKNLYGPEDSFVDRSIKSIKSDVQTIGFGAFQSCTSLTTVDIPNAILVGGSAFYNCTSLTTVDFPNVTSIGNSAFNNCTSLTTVDFSNVTSIDKFAFDHCTALEKLIIRTPSVCTITNYILSSAGKCQIYVPDNLVSQYKSATYWSQYANRIHGLSELKE